LCFTVWIVVMSTLQIALTRLAEPNPDGVSGFELRVGDAILTHLIRSGAEDTKLLVPVAPLAFWFAENWWRLRWEPRTSKPSDSWRMAHEMSAIGNGHAWPRVTIWGDRDRVMLLARAEHPGIAGPVRFLTNAVVFTPGPDFEATLDAFFEQAVGIVPAVDRNELKALLDALGRERCDIELSRWRRLEAVSGYDPDEAPELLISRLCELETCYRSEDVEEAVAAAPGSSAAQTLEATVEAATHAPPVDFDKSLNATLLAGKHLDRLKPWELAESVASELRRDLDLGTGPLLNPALGQLAGVSARLLSDHTGTRRRPYALRLSRSASHSTVLLTARWAHDRRFQLARAIGDAIWSNNSQLGPISGLSSSRQKFQRAFAAAVLCPVEGLREYLGSEDPEDSDIAAAARHFHVNEMTVRTVLVNKHLMERQRLGQPLSDPLDASRLDEVADAA
jgi:hypothetical protein